MHAEFTGNGADFSNVRHYQRWLLLEDLDQEQLRVQHLDTPRLQMLGSKVAKVEGHDDWHLGVDCAATCRSFSSFVILAISDNVTGDPCLAEVGAQLCFQMSGQ